MTANNIWYKNPILLILVLGMPIAMVLTCIWFIGFTFKHRDTTVRDDWYMDGKALYQDASKDELAYKLGVSGIMRLHGGAVIFELNYPNDSALDGDFTNPHAYPKTLAVTVSHATDERFDRDFILTHQDGNRYTGIMDLDRSSAYYYVQITANELDQPWRLMHKQKLPANNIVLTPLPAFASVS